MKLRFDRSESETESPFVGTAQVRIQLDYLDCLIEFYDTHPDFTSSGFRGEAVFDTWRDRLCEDDGEGDVVACSVVSMTQRLEDPHDLIVVYDVSMEPDLEGRILRFGPIPTAELMPCSDLQGPVARVGHGGAVSGSDASGVAPWEMEGYEPDRARADDEQVIRIWAGRP